jgi:flagellar hook-associated protein 2
VSESANGKTSYKLVADATATTDPAATVPADSAATLRALGFVENGRSAVTQQVTSQNTFQGAGGAASSTGTLLTDLAIGGNSVGIAANDTITIAGTRGDGTTVTSTLTVGAGDTLNTLLAKLNDATTGFGAGTRPATASFVNGQLVLTDSQGGDSQLALSMSVQQQGGGTLSLGRMNTSTVGRAREVVAGKDARLSVDGVVVTRQTNSISDVLSGVTLNLTQAEPGTTVDVTVARDADSITKSVDAIAKSYNDVLKFIEEQKKNAAPLHNDAALRASFAQITQSLLKPVVGVTGAYTQTAVAGLSLQKDGTLALDQSVFKAALATNYSDLQRLFTSGGSSPNSQLNYVYASPNAKPGTYGVNVTQIATIASQAGSGFSGTYADDATADTMTISDGVSGASGSISLANGDTIDTIVQKLNALFGNNRMSLTASKVGNDLQISGSRYGSGASFTVAYAAGGTDGSAQLGLAAGKYAGLDVAGTFDYVDANGVTQTGAATGTGTLLTGSAGTPIDGLSIDYTGAATGAVGPFTYIAGVGGALYNIGDTLVRLGGTVQGQQDALKASITLLSTRADTVQEALDRKRASLVAQFTAMETAIGRINSQATSLTSFINSMNAKNG